MVGRWGSRERQTYTRKCLQRFNPFSVILNEVQLHKAFYTATDQRYEFVLVSGTKGVYLEGRVQLKHFYKKQSIKHILCSQSNNGAAFVPDYKTNSAGPGKSPISLSVLKWRLVKADMPPHLSHSQPIRKVVKNIMGLITANVNSQL